MELSVFQYLLIQEESETLDFKRQWHENNAKLLHDILCLSNSYSDENRYLIFGVDDSGALHGVEGDSNRKTNANIQDLLRASNFSRIPDVKVSRISYEFHDYDIIEIKNRPDKPFFLTRDKRERDIIIRAGVIYSRLGDTNTPLGETASDERMELMWRERFGIGKSPLERFRQLIETKANWIAPLDKREMHNRMFPEFVIIHGKKINDRYHESWIDKFHDRSAYSHYIEVRYFNTLIEAFGFVVCDGGRYEIPIPRLGKGDTSFYIYEDSLEYKIADLYFTRPRIPRETLTDLINSLGIEIRSHDD